MEDNIILKFDDDLSPKGIITHIVKEDNKEDALGMPLRSYEGIDTCKEEVILETPSRSCEGIDTCKEEIILEMPLRSCEGIDTCKEEVILETPSCSQQEIFTCEKEDSKEDAIGTPLCHHEEIVSHEGGDDQTQEDSLGTASLNLAENSNNATSTGDGISETLNDTAAAFLNVAENSNNATSTGDGISETLNDTAAAFLNVAENSNNATSTGDGISGTLNDTAAAFPSNAEILQNVTILDEGIEEPSLPFSPYDPPPCPICGSDQKLFFIHFNEQILMCESVECEYPFGYAEVIYVKVDENLPGDAELDIATYRKYKRESARRARLKAKVRSDIDKTNKVNNTDGPNNPRSETKEYNKHRKPEKKKKGKGKNTKVEDNSKILKQVEAISKMNSALKKVDDRCITNEKWIKKLLNLQQSSGMSLLKPEEMKLIKQKKQPRGRGELIIDINSGSEQDVSMIKIDISNDSTPGLEATEQA